MPSATAKGGGSVAGMAALEVRRVDQLAVNARPPRPFREPGDETVLADVVAIGEKPNATRRQEMANHDALVIGPELVWAGQLVEARIRPDRIDGVFS
jgi:hypothetical protein